MLNKKSIDDINVKGRRVLVRCDFNVPLKNGEITDETRIVAALPTIQKLINDGAKVILCSHLGKVKNGPNEGESLAPVAKRLAEKMNVPLLGQIPIVQSICESGDKGTPVALDENTVTGRAFLQLAAAVVRQVDRRNMEMAPTRIVEVHK